MHSSYAPRTHCAVCGSPDLRQIVDFGSQPLAGHFPRQDELDDVTCYPLALLFCAQCTLVQTNGTIDPDALFRDYRYLSSFGLQNHFAEVAAHLKQCLGLTSSSSVVEIGSNDGVFLAPMAALGCNVIGFEPSHNVSKIARGRGCKVINEYFSPVTAAKHIAENSVDLVFAANCFAHIDHINSIVTAIHGILKDGGHAVIEVHYLRRLVEQLQYDFVYHEHAYYYSVTALSKLFAAHGMTIVGCEEFPVHSGSIRVYVQKDTGPMPQSIQAMIDAEREIVGDWSGLEFFAAGVQRHKSALANVLQGIKKEGGRIVGYGASGRANVLCNVCGIDSNLLDYIVDESPERYDRFIPVQNIPIQRKEVFDADSTPSHVLLLAWNYSRMIMEKLRDRQLRFIIPFPSPYCVNDVGELRKMQSL